MKTEQIKAITEVIKATAIEMIKTGYTGSQISTAIGAKFGNSVARLIMADIALDLGMTEQTKRYLARF